MKRRHRPHLESLEGRLCLAAPPFAPDYPGTPVQLPQDGAWTNSSFNGSPIFADLNRDGRDELITAISGSRLLALHVDAAGVLRPFRVYETTPNEQGIRGNFKSTPVVVDLPNGRTAIFAAMGRDEERGGTLEDGRVFGWDALTGAILPGWPQGTFPNFNNNFRTGVTGPMATGDLDGDGFPEIVVTSHSHFVTAFRTDGTVLWKYLNDETVEPGVVIGDIDRDGRNEVVFTSGMSPNSHFPAGGLINVLDSNGSARFRIPVGEAFFAAPLLADLTGDGYLEIVAAPAPYFANPVTWDIATVPGALEAGNAIYAFNYKGELLPGWPYRTTTQAVNRQFWKEMAAADLDGNGSIEIIALDAGGFAPNGDMLSTDPRLHVVQANGQPLPGWEGGRLAVPPPYAGQVHPVTAFASPIVADVNGDGSPDIIVGNGVFLMAFDRFGNILFSDVPGPGGVPTLESFFNAPAVGQLDGQGGLELATVRSAAANPNPPSHVSIFQLPASPLTPPWPMHRRDAAGVAIQHNLPFLQDFVEDVVNATTGPVFDSATRASYVAALAANRFNKFQFASALATNPAALGRAASDLSLRFLGRPLDAAAQAQLGAALRTIREVDLARIYAHSSEFITLGAQDGGMAGVVRRLHLAVFGAALSAGQANTIASDLQAGRYSYSQLVESWLLSNQALRNRMNRVYAALGRPFSIAEDVALGNAFRGGAHETNLVARILASGGLFGATDHLTRYVRTVYRDALGREATPDELALAVLQLDQGTLQPETLVRALLESAEGKGNFVREQYRRLLDREPNGSEIAALVNLMNQGWSRRDVMRFVLSSSEYFQQAGGTNTGFVIAAFHDIGYWNEENFPQSTLNDWVPGLDSGAITRATLADALIYTESIVELMYRYVPAEEHGILRNGAEGPGDLINPDPTWLQGLTNLRDRAGWSLTDISAALMTTGDYINKSAYWKGYYRSRGRRF